MRIQVLASSDSWHYQDLKTAAARFGSRLTLTSGSFDELAAGIAQDGFSSNVDADVVLARAMPGGSLEQVVFRMDVLMSLVGAGIRVVNSPKAIEAAVDKFLTLARLQAAGVPVPETRVSQTARTAKQHYEQLGGNVVVKPIFGSLGRDIFQIESMAEAIPYFDHCESTGRVIYQQQAIDHGGSDIRLLVIGDRVWGMRRQSEHWITNIRQGGQGHPHQPNEVERELALCASKYLGAEIAGVDLAYDRNSNQPIVLEVNSSPGWRTFGKVCDVDVASEIIEYLGYTPPSPESRVRCKQDPPSM